MTDDPAALADRLHDHLLAASPFSASMLGLRDYDAEVPDASVEGDERLRADVEAVLGDARAIRAEQWPTPGRLTLGCVADTAERTLLDIASADVEHTVTPLPFTGPAVLLAVAARTVIVDNAAAADYVTRLRRSGEWIDQISDRLRAGARRGRVPVAHIVAQAIEWVDGVLASRVPVALLTPSPPEGWDGAAAWRAEVAKAAEDIVRPALGRWRALLADELLAYARPDTQPGLIHLPGGVEDYARAVRIHTTLPVTAEELHRIGREHIAALEERALELGGSLGLADLASIHAAMRAAAAESAPDEAMALAVEAIRRAEARAGEVFPKPLPPPCEVTPMPSTVAESGMAPHYTPPRLDGGRPGTYWYNTVRPTAGTGWDLEAVAFHEAVPGHHLQLSRLQLFEDLPALQRRIPVTVHAEGWGLYAEQLADEMGLYSNARQQIGAVTASLMRAARLVIDTGLHALGWSRAQAVDYFTTHVPMPKEFLAAEVDRYIVVPGQALAYLTGKVELLRLRHEAQAALGERFTLPAFHAAVLDNGSLPMPVLADAVRSWMAAS